MDAGGALETVTRVSALRARVAQWRASGARIAFVPTMGNLHEGHMSLIGKARTAADRIVASIFVNPLQFGPDEDYQVYPRTLDADSAMLERAGVHLLFAPTVEEMYPQGHDAATRVVVPELSDILCGAHRPGHFGGMATVVCKLLNMVVADVAVFGEKDYQQLMIVRRMVEDLWIPTRILSAPTFRESDGLAMSSRNRYLTEEERLRAPALQRALRAAAAALLAQRSDHAAIGAAGCGALVAAGFRPNYFEVRQAHDLQPPQPGCRSLVVLAAGWLGKARLIDNVRVDLP
jgi:pantoate--beta-alanine ligase